jgi:hypothetical protein
MNPLLAITAAKLGSQLLGNLAGNNQSQPAQAAADAKKAAFAEMMAKVTSTPKFQHTKLLSAEGISNRADAESQLDKISNGILNSPEISKFLGSKSEGFDLRFNANGSVTIKKADGTERTFSLEGNDLESARKAVAIIESTKIAFAQNGAAPSSEPGGSLRISPGAKGTLLS